MKNELNFYRNLSKYGTTCPRAIKTCLEEILN